MGSALGMVGRSREYGEANGTCIGRDNVSGHSKSNGGD